MMLPSRQKTYYGFDDGCNGAAVFVSNCGGPMEALPLHCESVNHSPSGFAWGYCGSGPAQLALAILADYFGCAHAARSLHQQFKFATIAGIAERHWTMTHGDIVAAFQKLLGDRPWLERLAISDEGPTVQIVDTYAEHTGEFGRLLAVVLHNESEDSDEVVLVLPNQEEISLYRDQVRSVLLNSGVATK